MKIFLLTQAAGKRKREIVDYFTDVSVAETIKSTIEAEDPQISEIEVFSGEAQKWLDRRNNLAREAILNKLSEAERRLLGL